MKATPMLSALQDAWSANGWPLESLNAFRMEGEGEGGAGSGEGEGGEGAAGDKPGDAGDGKPTMESLKAEAEKWKALSRKHEGSAKTNAAAAKKLVDLEEAQKTEQQKLEDRATKAERDLATQQLESTRLHVALTKKLPAELAVRLQGDTEEEMAADADKLLGLIKANGGGGGPDMGQGARGTGAPTDDMNARLRSAAGR